MNFTQMHEHLRKELLRRIQRGTMSVSLLARQTGFGQAHLSNFLRCRRRLSLDAIDRILAAQHMQAGDLLPMDVRMPKLPSNVESNKVYVVSHHAALFEPTIRPSVIQGMLELPASCMQFPKRSARGRGRGHWERFVAVSVSTEEALPMDPLITPGALVVIDRHWNALAPYRPQKANMYAVREGGKLALRYLDYLLNRLVLRPHNVSFPIDFLEVPTHETASDAIAGRIALVLHEM